MSQLPSLALIPQDNAALSDEITRLAGHINAAQRRFLTLLAVLIERAAWEGDGIKSPAHWMNYHCGIDLGAAREKVRVAKSLQQLPCIDEANLRERMTESMVYTLDNFDLEAERIRIDILKVKRSLGCDLTDGQFSDCSFPCYCSKLSSVSLSTG